MSSTPTLRIAHLYPELLNLYGDSGNILVLRKRMEWRGISCEVQEVSLFVAALVQSERLGTSMANTLKSQADNMRDRRRQHVKAEAMKAPVKIIFPLVFFIFPSLFIVTLVPSALSLMKNLGH